jgi:ABC-type histidine transport system ATPase subunit
MFNIHDPNSKGDVTAFKAHTGTVIRVIAGEWSGTEGQSVVVRCVVSLRAGGSGKAVLDHAI